MLLNTEGVKSHADITGSDEPLPGRYHVGILNVDESFTKFKEAIQVDFQVLAGTVPNQEGRTHKEFFSTKGRAVDRLRKFAMVTGLIGPNERKNVEFASARGRQLIIEIEDQEFEGKKYRRMTFMGMWPIGDESVKDVPVNAKAIPPKGVKAEAAVAAAPSSTKAQGWGDL